MRKFSSILFLVGMSFLFIACADDGKDGATGLSGAAGVMGLVGPSGIDGVDGNDGADGATGATGADGKLENVCGEIEKLETKRNGESLEFDCVLDEFNPHDLF